MSEGNMEDPGADDGEKGTDDPQFPWEMGAVMVLPMAPPVCRHCILQQAEEFVGRALAAHPVPEEPWTSSSGPGLVGPARLVTTAAEHRIDLMLRVADWLLEGE